MEAVLGHPYLRVWAVQCLEQLKLAGAGAGNVEAHTGPVRDLATNLGYLGAFAAAVAARAGMGAMVTVPVIEGAVHLPALGRLVLGPPERTWPAAGEPDAAHVSVIINAVIIGVGESCWTLDRAALLAGTARADAVPGNTRTAEWQPVRMLRAGGFCVALDDIDPYRDSGSWPAAPRLTAAEAARWQREFEAAWEKIEREHMAYAPALAAGLTTLTPLTAIPGGPGVSAVARHAFGAVGRVGACRARWTLPAAHPGVSAREARRDSRPLRPLQPSRRPHLSAAVGRRQRPDRRTPAGRLCATGRHGLLAREPAAGDRGRG